MSAPPGRGGGGWSPFRPPSPYTQSPPPRLPSSPGMAMLGSPFVACPRPRWPSPISPPPLLPPGMSPPPRMGSPGPRPFRPMHPPSPAPPIRTHDYFLGIHPYRDSPTPVRCFTPEYFRSPIPFASQVDQQRDYEYSAPPVTSRDYEYVGSPAPPVGPPPRNYEPDEDENTGPTTAEIIANQSQDYIDEKLAEYQMTIYHLQGRGL